MSQDFGLLDELECRNYLHYVKRLKYYQKWGTQEQIEQAQKDLAKARDDFIEWNGPLAERWLNDRI